jgi:phage terminase small subunit
MCAARVAAKARVVGRPGAVVALTFYEQLTPHRRRFVDEYLIDLNGWQACLRSGLAPGSAYELLHNAKVIGAIKERRRLIDGERSISGAKHVLGKLWDLETADPRDLCEIWKVPCRFCWGIDNQYQFTKTEMRRRLQAHELGLSDKPIEALYPCGKAEYAAWVAGKAQLALDLQGGDAYTTGREPNPNCTECGGDGITIQHVTDTRKLTAGAKALYRGVKVTKDGLEILMADQAQAREMLARHYGVAVERKKILVRKLDPEDLSDEELVQSIEELEALNGQIHDAEYEVLEEPAQAAMPKRGGYTKPVPGKRTQTRRWYKKPPLITRPS